MSKQFPLLFFSFLFLFSCKAIDKLTMFDVDYQTTFSVSSTTLIDAPFNLLHQKLLQNQNLHLKKMILVKI